MGVDLLPVQRVNIEANALNHEARRKFKENLMRTITLALLALGFVGTTAISAPTTTMAQGVVLSDHGVGVVIVNRPYNRRHARYDRFYDHQPYAARYYRGSDRRLHVQQ
jgi:hypothetical protein